MKNSIFKKIVSVLLIIFMLVLVVSCGNGDELSVVVSFDTDGGSKIENVEISESNVTNFTLPANPTKEGYDFLGWYLDKECTNAFENVSIENGNITLYAKWQVQKTAQEINEEKVVGSWAASGTTAEFKEDKTCRLALPTGEVNGDYEIDGDGNIKITVKLGAVGLNYSGKLEDDKLTLNVGLLSFYYERVPSFDIKAISLPDLSKLIGADFTRKLEDSFVLNINMIDNEATDKAKKAAANPDTVETIYKDLKIQIDLNYNVNVKVEKFVVENIKDFKASIVVDGEFKASADGTEITDESYLATKKALEHFEIYIKENTVYVSFLKPNKVVTEQKTEYKFDETNISIDFEKLLAALKDYANNVYNLDNLKQMINSNVPDMIDNQGNVDIEAFANSINDAVNQGLTTLYTLGVNKEKMESIIDTIKGFSPTITKDASITKITMNKETILNAVENLEDFVQNNQVLAGIIYSYMNQSVMTVQEYNELVNSIKEFKEEFKNMFDIKSFEIIATKDDSQDHLKSVTGDIDFTIYLSDTHKSYLTITHKGEISVKSINVVIEFPDFTAYEDYTDTVIQIINQSK